MSNLQRRRVSKAAFALTLLTIATPQLSAAPAKPPAAARPTAAAPMDIVKPADPQQILGAVKELHPGATLDLTPGMDPQITVQFQRFSYSIEFYNCDNVNKNCQSLQFSIGFKDNAHVPLAHYNDWNMRKRYTRAYFNPETKRAMLVMDVTLEPDGMPRRTFKDNIAIFNTQILGFHDHLKKVPPR